MAQPSPDEEKILITQQVNTLLIKLNKSYSLLQKLNQDIESRPFSTRIHGQFDHELKKSQQIISKLSSLLRKYHSFEFSSSLSLEIKSDDNDTTKPIDTSFIIEFKDICLKIEREWRIGTKFINNFQSKYGQQNDDHYHSDNDTKYRHSKRQRHKNHNPKHSRSRSGSIGSKSARSGSSSPIHSFSNPNSPLFTNQTNLSQSAVLSPNPKGIPSLNLGLSQSQILQQKRSKYTKLSKYHSKIGKDFVPYHEEERLNKQIRDINDDLQYLLDINKQVNDLVETQGDNVDNMQQNVADAKDNVQQGTDTLTSIRRSPFTYGIIGGLGLAAFGAPIIAVGVGIKAAVGGALGLGTVGAYTGSVYAKKQNERMDEDNKRDKEQRLLNEEKEREQEEQQEKGKNKGFQTRPRRRNNGGKSKGYFGGYWNRDKDDDEDDVDVWDARN